MVILQQIACESAAQCEQIAASQQRLVVHAVTATAALVLGWQVVNRLRHGVAD